MVYAFLAAFLLFRLWLFLGAAVYFKAVFCSQPIYVQVRIALGVLSLGSVTIDAAARKRLVVEICGIPVPLQKKKKRTAVKRKNTAGADKKLKPLLRRLLPALRRSVCTLVQRVRITALQANVHIGLADDAGSTAVACAALSAAIGALARRMEHVEQLRSIAVVPCFGTDRLWVSFSCIVSLKLRHIIIETFKLIKEAFKWVRILSKTSWIQQ